MASMKIFLAVSGEYSDYEVRHAFARRQDAESYALGEDVLELDVHDGPVETRTWHTLLWNPGIPDREPGRGEMGNPYEGHGLADFTGSEPGVRCHWAGPPEFAGMAGPVLTVQGWDLARVRKVYSEQRAQYLARQVQSP
jgi:hypothetical protein